MRATILKNKRVTILGAARSGLAAAKLLCKLGSRVFVSDIDKVENKTAEIEILKKLDVNFEFGGYSQKIYDADLFITSPGISSEAEPLKNARRFAIPIWSEIELASRCCPGPIIAVTGSNGKSTTTALIGEMFKQANRKHVVAGNIGYPFSEAVLSMDSETTAIVEVSSFQLETIDTFKPQIAILLNLTPDHLDRYASFYDYAQAKFKIFKNQTRDDFALLKADDTATSEARNALNGHPTVLHFHTSKRLPSGCFVDNSMIKFQYANESHDIMPVNELSLPGKHNLANALAAVSAAMLSDIPILAIQEALRIFKPLEHRLEFVREINDVKYYNDSKATNIESMLRGLQSFNNSLIVIAGGRDKGDDYKKLQQTLSEKVKKLILLGEATEKMSQELENGVCKNQVTSLEEAVNEAKSEAEPGDIVLLCPGCSSFDMFDNFEHRGRQFKDLVKKL